MTETEGVMISGPEMIAASMIGGQQSDGQMVCLRLQSDLDLAQIFRIELEVEGLEPAPVGVNRRPADPSPSRIRLSPLPAPPSKSMPFS